MIIHGQTFHQFCSRIRGYRVYNKNGFEVYKYQIFFKGIRIDKLMTGNTKYKLKERI